MHRYLPVILRQSQLPARAASLGMLAVLSLGCVSGIESVRTPTAPAVARWPEYAFLPERQCRGRYQLDALERYVSRARLTMWLPGTRSVALDKERRCITVTVNSIGSARLAELIIRGVAVPRNTVLLLLARPERHPRRSA